MVETFFGEAIAEDLPMANSVRELAEWIVDRLLKNPEQLKTTLHRLDDGSPKVTELLEWADTLPAEGLTPEDGPEGWPERPLTSRERFDRRLRMVETGATVVGGVGSPMAIYYGLNRRAGEPEVLGAKAGGRTLEESEPELEISPRDSSPLRRSTSGTSDSESATPKSIGPLVQLDFRTGEGEPLVAQELLVEREQLEHIERWLSESDPQDLERELVFEGYVAAGGAPVPIFAEIEAALEPVSVRYQGPNLTLTRELPVLVAAKTDRSHYTEPPPDHGPHVAAFEVPGISLIVSLSAVAFLGAWTFRKVSQRAFRALFESAPTEPPDNGPEKEKEDLPP